MYHIWFSVSDSHRNFNKEFGYASLFAKSIVG